MAMDIDDDILTMNYEQREPQEGDLLVAEPTMGDRCFKNSVVCIISHSEDGGTMGLVTNKETDYDLKDLVPGLKTEEEIPVFLGGPVHTERLYYLHQLGKEIPDSIEVKGGLYISGDFDAVKRYVNSGAPVNGLIRFYLGYCGWEKAQLRGELDKYDWAVTELRYPQLLLLMKGRELWRDVINDMGEKYKLWLNCPPLVIMN